LQCGLRSISSLFCCAPLLCRCLQLFSRKLRGLGQCLLVITRSLQLLRTRCRRCRRCRRLFTKLCRVGLLRLGPLRIQRRRVRAGNELRLLLLQCLCVRGFECGRGGVGLTRTVLQLLSVRGPRRRQLRRVQLGQVARRIPVLRHLAGSAC
jgi:hypothetical protein